MFGHDSDMPLGPGTSADDPSTLRNAPQVPSLARFHTGSPWIPESRDRIIDLPNGMPSYDDSSTSAGTDERPGA
jgi:hypothetical protein